jgi:hypothetical protein
MVPARAIATYAQPVDSIGSPKSVTVCPAKAPEATAPAYSITISLAAGRTASRSIRRKTA